MAGKWRPLAYSCSCQSISKCGCMLGTCELLQLSCSQPVLPSFPLTAYTPSHLTLALLFLCLNVDSPSSPFLLPHGARSKVQSTLLAAPTPSWPYLQDLLASVRLGRTSSYVNVRVTRRALALSAVLLFLHLCQHCIQLDLRVGRFS